MDHDAEKPPDEVAWQLVRLIDGFVVTQLLYVAAKLGIADILAAGPRSGAEVAAEVGAQPDLLTRVMRGLTIEGVLVETGDGRFALTPLGNSFRGMAGAAICRGELYYHSAEQLLVAVRDGGVPFDRSHGATFFDHLHDHPDKEATFQASMAGRSEHEARAVIDSYDFNGLTRIVDVGGGRGVLLAAIVGATDGLTGVLVDREQVIIEARARLDVGLASRVECVAGDFFVDVPTGGDAYLLSRVLHDWDDDSAGRILAACRAAMDEGSRLLIVDAVLPEHAVADPGAILMDLHMLLLFGARERTEADFRRLLASSGFDVIGVHPTGSPSGLAVIEAVPG